jgi:diguanylate cyclase (GGDEF)-like protein
MSFSESCCAEGQMMPFNVAGLCFTGAEGLGFEHDPGLVAISYLVAVGGSFVALELIERWRSVNAASKRCWLLAGAAALGGTIWSMHFIGMLAVRIAVPLTYAPGLTLLSLVIAIVAVGVGLHIIRARTSPARVCFAGIVVGLGVSAMHYVGMSAVGFSGSLAYTPSLWCLSVLTGLAASTAVLWLSLTLRESWQRAAAAFVMGAAICGMHYIGMAAAVFQVDPHVLATHGLSPGPAAAAVAVVTAALMLCAIVVVGTDRRLLAAAQHEAEQLRLAHIKMAQSNAALEISHQQLDAVLNNITHGVCFFDGHQRLLLCNPRYAEIYNLSPEATSVGRSLEEIVDARYAAGSAPDMSRSDLLLSHDQVLAVNQPARTVRALRNGRFIAINHQPMPGGGWVATHDDITEQKQAEVSILFMARHDALTKLPNRVLFRERMEQAIALAGRGSQFAVLCIDLDKFKLVNDTFGHPVGDGLLVAVAGRLQDCVREIDTTARLGGDEFAIIQFATQKPDDADALAQRILAAFRKPFDIGGHQIMSGVSIGAIALSDIAKSYENVMRDADIALYLAKTEGRGTVRFFEPEMDARIHEKRLLERELQGAASRNEFELYYQPQVSLITNRIIGFEALIRWRHPTRGLVSPMDFIPVAEETGIIVEIGEWVLRTACFEAENWQTDISVAVNLSPVQFRKQDLVATVQAALDASGLNPDRLELEITESVFLSNSEDTLAALHQLRAMGVKIALDDFGTGYSSLSYLQSFPFSKIKIDKSFVRDLGTNKESMSIVRAVIGLGQSLNMTTIAEGVETREQLDKLRTKGCAEAQGYLFSRPRPADELPSLIESLHEIDGWTGLHVAAHNNERPDAQ